MRVDWTGLDCKEGGGEGGQGGAERREDRREGGGGRAGTVGETILSLACLLFSFAGSVC